ncbi:MAG: mechanosensitive ion channel domain-containing protein [Cyanobacteria bacterium P01_A01_bin.135]
MGRWRYWGKSGLLGLAAALVVLLPLPSWAQLGPLNLAQTGEAQPVNVSSAPVVVDGRVIFEIQGAGGFSARERAKRVNAALAEQVQRAEAPEIDAVQNRDRDLVYLQPAGSDEVLVTVTPADVAALGQAPLQQGREWAVQIEAALETAVGERQPAYLRRAGVYALVLVGGAIALQVALLVLGRAVARRLGQWFERRPRFEDWEKPVALFWRLGLLGVTVGLWLTVGFYVTDIFPVIRRWRYTLDNILNAKIVNLGSQPYSALELLLLVGLIVGVWFAANLVTRLLRFHLLNRARLEKRVQDILTVLIRYTLIFLGTVLLLQVWGIDLSSLAIIASVLGVGIGFGVQNITNNFISGFIITVESPIQVGDFVKVGDLVGSVENIGARSTEIRTLDQVTIIIPNSRFLESEVINWSHGNPVSRLHVPVSVAYGSDLALVKAALLEAIRRHPEVLLRPQPEVWFQGFGDSALDFEIMVWTGDPRKQFRVKSDLNYEIEASLRRHNIEIPFPQRDLHLRSPQMEELVALLKQGMLNQPAQANGQGMERSPNQDHPPQLPYEADQ